MVPASSEQPASLSRSVGVGGAVILGLGSMVGTGVFVSIHLAGAVAGPAMLVAVLIAALLALANALSSAQLAAAHPVSGGTYEYGYRYLSPLAGFMAGWMFLLAKSASAATAALASAAYLLQTVAIPLGPVPIALGAVAAVVAITLLGLRRTTAVNAVIVSGTFVSLLLLVVVAAPGWSPDNLRPFLVPQAGQSGARALLYATALVFVAFTGYGRIATLGEEIRDPRRNIPRAIALTVAVVAVLYMAVALAGVGSIGAATVGAVATEGGAPLQAVASAATGSGARGFVVGTVVAFGALAATLGVLLNLILGLSRVLLAMGRRGDMPRMTARVAGGTPRIAVLIVGLIVAMLVLARDVRVTWSFSAITVLLYYATANAAALAVDAADRIYPRWVSVVGLVGCLGVGAFVDPRSLIAAAISVLVGLCWFGAARARR